MLDLSLKHTKVYKKAFEEGRQEGIQEAKLEAVTRILILGLSSEIIAESLDLPL